MVRFWRDWKVELSGFVGGFNVKSNKRGIMTPQFWAQRAKKGHLTLINMVEMARREGIVGEIRTSVEHVLSLWCPGC